MTALPASVHERLRNLPKGLRDHVERSREVARVLAEIHDVDKTAVDLAVAAHDLARGMKGGAILEEALRHGLDLHPVEKATPALLHGPVAAVWLERTAGITDERVLDAVRWHSTGKRGMGPVAMVVFLADKLDPEKVRRDPWLREVEALASEDMGRAVLRYLDGQLRYLLDREALIHSESVELRNELMAERGPFQSPHRRGVGRCLMSP